MPSPINDDPEPSPSERLSQRLASLSPAQRDLLKQRLAGRAAKRPADSPSGQPGEAKTDTDLIAVVGMGCRFPGAASIDEYWQLIQQGREVVGPIPGSRWDRERYFDPSGRAPGKMSVDAVAAVDDVDRFDPAFFGIAPREASRMDPQQRLLLEVVWEAFENACIPISSMAGSNTGVFIGIGGTDYSKVPARYSNYFEHVDVHIGTGNALSIAAGRISYLFDFHGPSLIVDTACSSSLVAVHSAVVSLLRGDCDAAVVGGVNLVLSPETSVAFSKAKMLSPDGHCRPFDAAANGYVRGEGCGVVLLKRYRDAVAQGDTISGILLGSAVNQDGRTSGITAPSSEAQTRVIGKAMQMAGVDINDLTYIEAHGTGTPLGDPIELVALGETFGPRSSGQQPIRVGSVKANIGHTETASGIAGLLKVLQMFAHRRIPAQANFQSLNTNVSLPQDSLRIADRSEDWQPNSDGKWIAGISSFGFGGTNAHLVVQAPQSEVKPNQSVEPQKGSLPPGFCLPISTRDESALRELASRYSAKIADVDAVGLRDVCGAAAAYRCELPIRAVALGDSVAEMQAALDRFAADQPAADVITGRKHAGRRARIAMLFTGQGSQYVGMASRLEQTLPAFRDSLRQCGEILDDLLPIPLRHLLGGASDYPIDHTSIAQPAICAVQCALVDALKAQGIVPDVVAGHSIGEIAALYAAGAFDRREALLLAAYRGQVMGALPSGGAMAAILTDADTVHQWIDQQGSSVVIAAYNGSDNTVIAGRQDDVDRMVQLAGQRDVAARPLAVSHAFHSPLITDAVDPLREKLETFLKTVELPASVKFLSTVSGDHHGDPVTVDYWLDHLVQPVRFTDVIQKLAEMQLDLAIEVGPNPQLCGMIRRTKSPDGQPLSLPTVATLDRKQDDHRNWLKAISTAWCVGVGVDWNAVGGGDQLSAGERPAEDRPPRIPLPTYPFQRQMCWYDPPKAGNHEAKGPIAHPLLGTRQPLAGGETIYQVAIGSDDPSYLGDHVVSGSVTVPAAAWIEAIRAAAAAAFSDRSFTISDIEIERALFLEPGKRVLIQINVQPVRGGRSRIRIDALIDPQEQQWQTCASAQAIEVTAAAVEQPLSLPQPAAKDVDRDDLYSAMAEVGLEYGEDFQVLDQITSDGQTAAATLIPSKNIHPLIIAGGLHPTLLDGAIQLIATVIPTTDEKQSTFLPAGVKQLTLGQPDRIAAVRVRRRHPQQFQTDVAEVVADVELIGAGGAVVARLDGVRLKALTRDQSSSLQDPASWIYRVQWQPVAHQGSASTDRDDSALGKASMPLRHFGSKRLDSLIASSFESDPHQREHWIWTASEAADVSEDLSVQNATESLLEMVQAAVTAHRVPMLSVITQHAVAVTEEEEAIDPAATAVVAMARVAANEHPQLELRILDVDRIDESSAPSICKWMDREDSESEQAMRDRRFFCPRLTESPQLYGATGQQTELGLLTGGSYRVRLDGTNRMEGLWVERMAPPAVEPGEVMISTRAVGLNFSDVLKSMGLYPGIRDDVVPMGIEVCGEVTSVGPGVDGLTVGTRVMGIVPHGFASHVATKDYLIAPVPDFLSDEEAASIPIVFLTAHHALLNIGRLCKDDSVLIHAGAGGVGLAAIQVARSVGATVYATAGSPTKRQLLASMGVDPENIFDSRDIGSIEAIRDRTGGRGVDVVLNSLPGQWIDASIGLLAAHGRFLEIGKTDIYQNRAIGLLPFQDNLTYSAIDLDRMLRHRPAEVRQLFAEVVDRLQQGIYEPTPLTSFRLDELPAAMRFMAARRNVGKIVLSPPAPAPDSVQSKGAYLITGGSGAIALAVARRLIQRGAGAVALVARSQPSDDVKQLQSWAASRGAICLYQQADCSDRQALRGVVDTVSDCCGSVVGVIHAAGLLDDGLIHEMTTQSLHRVLAPKVDGVIALDRVTQDQPLKSFVLLGSVASVFGSPGQANYAAANAFLDGFASDRRRKGLPASLVHWGPWASAGMADDPTRLKNLAARGLRPLRFDAAVDLLIDAGASQAESAVIVDADFGRMLAGVSSDSVPSLLRSLKTENADVVTKSGSTKDVVLLAELESLDHQQCSGRLAIYFAEQLGRIMSMDAASIDPSQPLGALGLDSLMAIELKNTIEAKLDITLPINRFIDDPTLESLSEAASEILSPAEAKA